ncbi:SDR family oxidoreductase [Chitinibacter sp. S2-10]|uniref:SDR family oxidoreductase n=1 Tax=Chitinibacter sp. S2-10 TaxID=3373597 RepID=UPI00397744A3
MRVLILGGSGLIGSALAHTLRQHGHPVSILSRSDATDRIDGDFRQLTSVADWLPLLNNIDVVVNAVGIFSESATQSFADLHINAPQALFKACEQCGLARVIQISALGAAVDAATPYWRSKGIADAALQASSLDWSIIRPSLIYSPNGKSSRFFCSLASFPVLPDMQGIGQVQPVHLDDVIALLVKLVESSCGIRHIINVVGPQAMTLNQWWQQLRHAMGLRKTVNVGVYEWMQYLAIHATKYLPNALFNRDSLSMLRAGNTADVKPFSAILSRTPKAAQPDASQDAVKQAALLAWLLPLLRFSLAAVWIITALVSWFFPRADSYALLEQVGIAPPWQPLLFYSSIAIDAAFGVLCLLNRAWRLQLALVLFYSLIIAICLPQFLYHPFGPLLKNLPILALIYLFDQLKPR